MFKKELIIGLSTTLLFLALFGTSFAGEGNSVVNIGTEAGDWQYSFDASETSHHFSATTYQYNQESLAKIGTEAGNHKYRFDAAETKEDIAARSYEYDQESLALFSTEAGDWQYVFDTDVQDNANRDVAEKGSAKSAICNGC